MAGGLRRAWPPGLVRPSRPRELDSFSWRGPCSEWAASPQRQDRSFRVARSQRPVLAVGDQVERLEHDLADEDLAARRSYDRLGIGGQVPDRDRDHCHRPLFPAFVRVDDGSRSVVPQPELARDLFRYHQVHRPGVDDAFYRRPSDVGFGSVSAVYVLAVAGVLQPHAGSDFAHRVAPLILNCLLPLRQLILSAHLIRSTIVRTCLESPVPLISIRSRSPPAKRSAVSRPHRRRTCASTASARGSSRLVRHLVRAVLEPFLLLAHATVSSQLGVHSASSSSASSSIALALAASLFSAGAEGQDGGGIFTPLDPPAGANQSANAAADGVTLRRRFGHGRHRPTRAGAGRRGRVPTIHAYTSRQQTVSEHQQRIGQYLRLRAFDAAADVENDLGFSVHFQQPGEKVDPGEVCALLAAILAHGCNLGLYTMEKVAPDIAYRRLKYVSDWRLVEENQRAALAAIVHGISRLDAASHWGDGTTSASDGQRFAMPHKVLQRTYSTRFNDFALEFYSFVADNYAPFYSRPIECTDRDAPFVLDGVLYHESDLDLEEHYTDTHGYTEINFAAFVMVGMRFCPRIRSLHRQRIYCADPARDHGVLEPVLQRGRRAVNFRLIAQQWDRIGQFYAAFPAGHATASAALQRLNRFQASNRFYAANREPKLRAKVRRGLLKVEQLHALARAVYYGQRGLISAREVYDQMNACSCLTLILACIVYWQAREISRIAAAPDFPFDPDLLRHVSPIEWKNVILYGEIKIDPAKLKMRGP